MHTYLDKSSKKSTDTIQQKKTNASNETIQRKSENNTRLPMNLKANMEQMSGMNLDDVVVHHNSSKPAQMKALAYTQGSDIHIGPGQEQHLGHEAWHVVQQKQNRVAPTTQLKGVNINDNSALEHEADVMGAKAVQMKPFYDAPIQRKALQRNANAIQMKKRKLPENGITTHKGMRSGGDTLEYDENSKFANELEPFKDTIWVEISKLRDANKIDERLRYCLANKIYLTPRQLKASYKLAEAGSKKATLMGFLTKAEVHSSSENLSISTMGQIQKNSEQSYKQKKEEAIDCLLYKTSYDNIVKNIFKNDTHSTVAYEDKCISFNKFESNYVYSAQFTGCTMAIFNFKTTVTINKNNRVSLESTTNEDKTISFEPNNLMVAHVSKNIADKFYTLIDHNIIDNVHFFVPNSEYDTSKGNHPHLGEIHKDKGTFKGVSTKYNGMFVPDDETRKEKQLQSVKDFEQDRFDNLLLMMTGALFDKSTNSHYHVGQFSMKVIKKGLKKLKKNTAIFNGVIAALNNLKEADFEYLPEPVKNWYQENK